MLFAWVVADSKADLQLSVWLQSWIGQHFLWGCLHRTAFASLSATSLQQSHVNPAVQHTSASLTINEVCCHACTSLLFKPSTALRSLKETWQKKLCLAALDSAGLACI